MNGPGVEWVSYNVFILIGPCHYIYYIIIYAYHAVLTIRLVANGENQLPQGQIEGRVEVYHNGVWGTVCDDYWDMNDARVVCRQLGYDFVLEAPVEAEYGAGTDQIWLDDVGCSGDESDIADCNHNGWGVVGLCNHLEDAGVKCSGNVRSVCQHACSVYMFLYCLHVWRRSHFLSYH